MHVNSFMYYYDIGYLDKDKIPKPAIDLVMPRMTSNVLPAPFVASAKNTMNLNNVEAFRAFDADSNSNSVYRSNELPSTAVPIWLKIDLGTSKACNMFRLRAFDSFLDQTPMGFSLEGSNDDLVWVELYRVTNNNLNIGQYKEFYFPNDVGYRYYRLNVRSVLATTRTSVSDLVLINNFYGHSSKQDTFVNALPPMYANSNVSEAVGVEISASGNVSAEPPWFAFNGTQKDVWSVQFVPSVASPVWLKVDFGEGVTKRIVRYRIGARGNNATQMPKDWNLLGSNDDVNYTLLSNCTGWNDTFWTPYISREFPIPDSATPVGTIADFYRYYKLEITVNAGSATYTALAQLQLSET